MHEAGLRDYLPRADFRLLQRLLQVDGSRIVLPEIDLQQRRLDECLNADLWLVRLLCQ